MPPAQSTHFKKEPHLAVDVLSSAGLTQPILQDAGIKQVMQIQTLHGGSTCKLYYLKAYTVNHTSIELVWKYKLDVAHDFFASEVRSLQYLKQQGFKVPQVILQTGLGLLLSYHAANLKISLQQPIAQQALARELARLHRLNSKDYGFPHANYIGVCRQRNQSKLSWPDFYWSQRLAPLVEHHAFTVADNKLWRRLAERLPRLLSHQPVARLCHGDAWQTNFIFNQQQQIIMLDPAPAYMDVAMEWAYLRYFKVLDATAEAAYSEILPLPDYLDQVSDLYLLYYLLVHLHQCGEKYLAPIHKILRFYTANRRS